MSAKQRKHNVTNPIGNIDSKSLEAAQSVENSPSSLSIPNSSNAVSLAKTITLTDAIALIVGTLIGSGIFITPSACLIQSGSVGASLLVWLVSGLFSLLGALSFAELGTTITHNGGEYSYILSSFGHLPAFLYSWVNVLIIRPVIIAIVILSFGYYLYHPLRLLSPGMRYAESSTTTTIEGAKGAMNMLITSCTQSGSQTIIRLIGMLGLGILLFINCFSVKFATRFQIVLTFAKVFALLVIILIGFLQFYKGKFQNFHDPFKGTKNIKSLSLAFYAGLFTYGGWPNLNSVTGEMKNVKRDLPLSIIIGIPIVIVIYILTNVAYLTVLTPKELITSTAVAFDFSAQINPYLALIMPIFVAFSAFGSANALLFTTGRIFLMSASNAHLPLYFAMIHIDRLTPIPSIIIQGLISLIYIFTQEINVLINFMSFMSYFFTTMCVVGLLYLRWKYPQLSRPIRFPILIHITFIAVSIFVLVTSLVSSYRDIGMGLIVMVSGIPVYYAIIDKKLTPKSITTLIDKITVKLQYITYVVLPDFEDIKTLEEQNSSLQLAEEASKL